MDKLGRPLEEGIDHMEVQRRYEQERENDVGHVLAKKQMQNQGIIKMDGIPDDEEDKLPYIKGEVIIYIYTRKLQYAGTVSLC